MKKNLKSRMFNIQRGWAFTVMVICLSLIACEQWFGEGGSNDYKGKVYVDHLDTPFKPLKHYGWRITRGNETQAGLKTPVSRSSDTTTWSSAGGAFVTQGDWKGSSLFTGLRGGIISGCF